MKASVLTNVIQAVESLKQAKRAFEKGKLTDTDFVGNARDIMATCLDATTEAASSLFGETDNTGEF